MLKTLKSVRPRQLFLLVMHTKCHEGAVGDQVDGAGGGRSRKGKVVAFSIAFAVLGEATFTCLRRSELRLLGRRYDVETFEEDRPGAFCNRCSGWRHMEPRFTGASFWCSLREWDHHQRPVEGRRAKKEKPCTYGVSKCRNCCGPHFA